LGGWEEAEIPVGVASLVSQRGNRGTVEGGNSFTEGKEVRRLRVSK